MKRLVSLFGATVLSLSICQASLAVYFVSQGTPGGGPNNGTVYTYELDILTGATVRTGVDYFILYDFGPILGMKVGDFVAPDWQIISLAGVGDIPPNASPFDDPRIPNVQVRYQGAGDLVGPKFDGIADLFFYLESPTPTLKNGVENAASSFYANGRNDGLIFDLPVPDAVAAVPEPGPSVLLGAGLLGIVGLIRRKQLNRA